MLGPLAATAGVSPLELGAPKQRALLAILLAQHNEPVPVGRIITALWGEDAPDTYRKSIYTYVSNLRALLGVELARVGDGYRLGVEPDQIDSAVFEKAVERAQGVIVSDPHDAASQLRAALEMWHGRPYADVSDLEFLQGEIRRLEELRLTAVESRIEADLVSGRHSGLIAEVGALAEEHPLRERFRVQHMVALYRSGRQADALRAFERTREYLAEEMGLEPSQELQDLELSILQHDETLTRGTSGSTTQRVALLAIRVDGQQAAWEGAPDDAAGDMAQYERAVQSAIDTAGGHIFRRGGEDIAAAFSDIPSAVQAAEAAQRALFGADWQGSEGLTAAIGIDIGEAESRGGAFFGPPLNRASRLAAAAHGGQVLLSAEAQLGIAATSSSGVQVRQLGEGQLRGFSTTERIAQLVIDGLPSDFPELQLDRDPRQEGVWHPSLPGYELRELIGQARFGSVFRAYQPAMGREVAIKIIRPQFATHAEFIHRFEAEARSIARMTHPHVVPLIDYWRDLDGAYLVMPLMIGGSLDDLLEEGLPGLSAAAQILHDVGAALDYAHSEGIAHGALKPSNVLFDSSGNAYVSDFAVAARLLDPEVVSTIDDESQYRAPEEASDGPSPIADQYSFGLLARRLLPLPDIEPILDKASAVNPSDRFADVRSLVASINQALGLEEAEIELPGVTRNPYKGLRAFDETDHADFYGRADLVETMLSALNEHSFVCVVGASGSGKSSAVKAGLIPALRSGALPGSEGWITISSTPGTHPVESMIEAFERVVPEGASLGDLLDKDSLEDAARLILPGGEGRLIIVVDQFEELFVHAEPGRRQRFIDLLTEQAANRDTRIKVVTTLRADFYDRPLEHPGLDRLLRDGQVTVIRPDDNELIEIIRAPAQAVGLRWEPGLPERIARDVSDEPGALPLLQYALTAMVERRSGDLLTMQDYHRVGGVTGALAKRAEATYGTLREDLQPVAREVLLQLVWVDDSGEDTRRRVRRSELHSLGINRSDLDSILARFIDERLLIGDYDPVTRGPNVEVAHESLLGHWPRLAAWIEDERESLILARRLRLARDEWAEAGEDPDYLLTGSRLAPFLGWAEKAALSADERDFLERSNLADQKERLARRRRRRVLTAIVGAAAVVALVLAGWAFLERDRATEQASAALTAEQQAEAQAARAETEAERAGTEAERADVNARLARSRELAASAITALEEDPELATLLALESIESAPENVEASASGVLALRQAVESNQLVERFESDVGAPTWARISADGSTIYSWSPVEGLAAAIDVDSGSHLWTYEEPGGDLGGEYSRLALSPDESLVAIFVFAHSIEDGAEPKVVVLNAQDGQVVTVLEPGPCPEPEFGREGFTGDGRWLVIFTGTETCGALHGEDDWATVYDTSTWVESMRLSVEDGAYERVTFSDGGDRVLISAWNGPTELRTFPDLELITEFGASSLASLSPDGERVVRVAPTGGTGFSGSDRRPLVYDASTGRQLFYLDAVDNFWSGDGIVFSPDGSKVVITTRGHDYVFSLADGRLLTDLGETGQTNSAWFTADGQRLVTAMDGPILLWDLPEGGGPVGTPIETRSGDPTWVNPNNVLNGPLTAVQTIVTHEDFGLQLETVVINEKGDVLHSLEAKSYQLADGRFAANLSTPGDEGLIWGPLVIWDPSSGEVIELSQCTAPTVNLESGLPSECPDDGLLFGYPRRNSPDLVSPQDGSFIAAATYAGRGLDTEVLVWDTETLDLRSRFGLPASEALYRAGPDWVAGLSLPDQYLVVRDIATGGLVARHAEVAFDVFELSYDGSVLYLSDAHGAVWAFDTTSWEPLASWAAHEARLRGLSISPDDGRLVTTGQDNVIQVWDISGIRDRGSLERPPLLDRLPTPLPSDAVWLAEDRLGVLLSSGARWLEVSLSVDDLVARARDQLTRSFTPNECATYEIDPCPSLEDVTGG